MPVITTGTIVFAAIGATILGTVGWATHDVRVKWLETLLGNVEDRINEVAVQQLSKELEHELLYESRGNMIDSSGIMMQITGYGREPSDLFRFSMYSEDGRVVSWYQRMPSNEFLIAQFRIAGGRERAVALKYKDRLKKVANEAYVMWKMSQP